MMFCNSCGSQVAEGSTFCTKCGAPLSAGPPTAAPPARIQQPPKKGGFFSSPGGIALIVIVSLLIVAGVVIGILLTVRGGSDSAFENEIAKVWEEYEDIVSEADEELAKIDFDADALARSREELEKTRKKVEALEDELKNLKPPDKKWKVKYEQLAGTLNYYDRYMAKLGELYVTLAAGALDTQVNTIQAILTDLSKLASEVKSQADDFLADNTAVTSTGFNPDILNLPTAIADEVEKVIKGEATDSGTETTTDESDSTAAARAVLEKVLSLYASGGWQAITGYMTPALLEAYQNAPIPWDQVSYVVTGTSIESANVVDPSTVVFRVIEKKDDFGEIYSESVDWQMTEIGGTWLVNNATNEYGESKL